MSVEEHGVAYMWELESVLVEGETVEIQQVLLQLDHVDHVQKQNQVHPIQEENHCVLIGLTQNDLDVHYFLKKMHLEKTHLKKTVWTGGEEWVLMDQEGYRRELQPEMILNHLIGHQYQHLAHCRQHHLQHL